MTYLGFVLIAVGSALVLSSFAIAARRGFDKKPGALSASLGFAGLLTLAIAILALVSDVVATLFHSC